jgi:hypothetical protein
MCANITSYLKILNNFWGLRCKIKCNDKGNGHTEKEVAMIYLEATMHLPE